MRISSKKQIAKTYLMVFTPVILVVLVLLYPILKSDGYFTGRNENICVASKEIMMKGTGKTLSREKLVFTEEEVYAVEDWLWKGHFESLTLFNKIKERQCYQAVTVGERFGLLSWKRNIIEVK